MAFAITLLIGHYACGSKGVAMAGSDSGQRLGVASIVTAGVAVVIAVVALIVAVTHDTTTGTNLTPWTGTVSASRHATSSTTATFDGTVSSDTTGNARIHSEVTLHGSNYTGTSTITTNSGDTLRAAIAGWDVPATSTTEIVTLTLKIESGSGKYASASGNATGSGTIDSSAASSQLSLSFSGVLNHEG
jgi:hypothetical protein